MEKRTYRILLASTGGHIGGEETFTRNLALALLAAGHQVWVAPGGPVQRADLEKNTIPIADLPISGRNLPGLIRGARAISDFAVAEKIDIIHCQAAGPAIMGAVCRWLRLPAGNRRWLWHDHGVTAGTYRWLPRILNRLDQSIANSDYELIKLLGNGVRNEKIRRIHNGIDSAVWCLEAQQRAAFRAEIRSRHGIPAEARVWGYAGRLSPEKGCDLFMPSATTVLKHQPNARFLIIGDGVMADSLKAECAAGGISDRVIFCGFQTDMPRYLSAPDVLILPSKMETFSLTVLQAMALQLPVIATDVGGNPEQILSGYNGLLCRNGDAAGLAGCIDRLLASPQECDAMGNAGRRMIEKYLNVDRMVRQIEETYDSLMEACPA